MEKRKALNNLIFCSIMHGLNHYLLIFYKPMYPMIREYFGLVNISDITVRMTLIYASYGISNFLSGFIARYFSLKKILFFGMLLMSISTFMIAFIPEDSFILMVILVVMIGVGGGTYHPAANTFITSSYEGRPGHAIGMLSIGSALGLILAPIVGEFLGLKFLGFKKLFFISGLISMIFSIIFLLGTEDHKILPSLLNQKASKKKHLKYLFYVILLFSIPLMLKDMINFGYYEITPFWVKAGFSCGISISIVQMMLFLPGIIIQPLTGKFCDIIKPLRVLIITFIFIGVGSLLLIFSNLIILWIGLIVLGIGMTSATVAGETYVTSIVEARDRSIMFGFMISISLGLGGSISGISGWIVDIFGKTVITGYQIWFALSGLLIIISTFLIFFIEKFKKTEYKS